MDEDLSDRERLTLVPCRLCTVAFHVECVPIKYKKEDSDKRKEGCGHLARLWLPMDLGGVGNFNKGAPPRLERRRRPEAGRSSPPPWPPLLRPTSAPSRSAETNEYENEVDTPLLYCDRHERRQDDPSAEPSNMWYPLDAGCAGARGPPAAAWAGSRSARRRRR